MPQKQCKIWHLSCWHRKSKRHTCENRDTVWPLSCWSHRKSKSNPPERVKNCWEALFVALGIQGQSCKTVTNDLEALWLGRIGNPRRILLKQGNSVGLSLSSSFFLFFFFFSFLFFSLFYIGNPRAILEKRINCLQSWSHQKSRGNSAETTNWLWFLALQWSKDDPGKTETVHILDYIENAGIMSDFAGLSNALPK